MNAWPPARPGPWVIGMVHLLALPGTPFGTAALRQVVEQAQADAGALVEGGADAVLVQNRGDRAFAAQHASPEVVAGVAVAAQAVVDAVGTRAVVGVHVLRNDVVASLGVARAVGARFVRAAVLTGRAKSAQGRLTGDPDRTLRYRAQLGGDGIALLADVATMHNPRGVDGVAEAAHDAVFFGAADAVLVADRDPTTAVALATRARAAGRPVLIGGYAELDTAAALVAAADGVIVGSAVERGDRSGGVDPDRVRAFVAACRG